MLVAVIIELLLVLIVHKVTVNLIAMGIVSGLQPLNSATQLERRSCDM